MRRIAQLFAVLMMAFGALGIVLPDIFFESVQAVQLPPLLYLAAAIRVVVGVVFLLVARQSRFPGTIRALGFFVIVAGLLTPFVGAQVLQVVLAWWQTGGPLLIRLVGCVVMIVGASIFYAMSVSRTPPR